MFPAGRRSGAAGSGAGVWSSCHIPAVISYQLQTPAGCLHPLRPAGGGCSLLCGSPRPLVAAGVGAAGGYSRTVPAFMGSNADSLWPYISSIRGVTGNRTAAAGTLQEGYPAAASSLFTSVCSHNAAVNFCDERGLRRLFGFPLRPSSFRLCSGFPSPPLRIGCHPLRPDHLPTRFLRHHHTRNFTRSIDGTNRLLLSRAFPEIKNSPQQFPV